MADGKEEREERDARLEEQRKRSPADQRKIPWSRRGDQYDPDPPSRGEPERGGS